MLFKESRMSMVAKCTHCGFEDSIPLGVEDKNVQDVERSSMSESGRVAAWKRGLARDAEGAAAGNSTKWF